MARYRITISSSSGQAMSDLVRIYTIPVLDHGARRQEGRFSVDAIVDEADIARLRQAGYTVEQHEDVDLTGKERQQEVGQGDRYKKDRPR
jgi:hypothetical protein